MKDKITISLDENILSKIDNDVANGLGKNRSSVIENILKEKYGNFTDVTAIIFAHDNKWDNRLYPFDVPKALLSIKGRSVIKRQVEIFSSEKIRNIIITIPLGTTNLFKSELMLNFLDINFIFLEIDSKWETGVALKEVLKQEFTDKNLIISNGDIYFGDLNLGEYYNYHKEQNSDFSFLLKFVFNAEQLGNVKINGNKIIDFVEKPKANLMYLTNSGLYITNRAFLNSYDFGNYLEKDYFPRLPDIGNIISYIHSGPWEHIQNDSAYERANGWLI